MATGLSPCDIQNAGGSPSAQSWQCARRVYFTVPRFAPLAVLMTGSCGQPWDNIHLLWTTVIVRRFTLHSETLSQIQINTKIHVFPCRVAHKSLSVKTLSQIQINIKIHVFPCCVGHKCISPSKLQTQGSSEHNSFTKTAWGSNKIYNHNQNPNNNRQAKPRHFTTLSQFHSFSQTTNLICLNLSFSYYFWSSKRTFSTRFPT
jgi:hypothetical protein